MSRPQLPPRFLAFFDQAHAHGVDKLNDLLTELTPMIRDEGRAVATFALTDIMSEWPTCKLIGLAAIATVELAASKAGDLS